MKPGRIACSVPGCKRSCGEGLIAGRPLAEWVCPKHWAAVGQRLRWYYSKARKAAEAEPDDPIAQGRLHHAWKCCRNKAIEKAMGV